MGKAKSVDLSARWIAAVSLAVAVGSFVIGGLSYVEDRREFRALQSEALAIQLNPHVAGSPRMTGVNLGLFGRVVQIPWQLVLSNTGNQRLSVTRYSIENVGAASPAFYSGIDGGMFEAGMQRTTLPLVLEPGTSREFALFVGVLVPLEACSILDAEGVTNATSVHDIAMILGRHGIDIYGNRVTYHELPGGGYAVLPDSASPSVSAFKYEATTGRGRTFSASASPYELPDDGAGGQ
jgi:hypothetical protein